MKIALFVTCLGDVAVPAVGRATVTVLERLGHEVVFPPAQTCCGQMHTNTGYQRDAVGPRAPPRRRVRAGPRRGLRRDRRAVGVVRRLGPPPARGRRASRRRRGPGRSRRGRCGPHLRALRAARRRARRHRRRRRRTRTGSPTTPPATRCGCWASATGRCGCCARCAASTWSSCPPPTSCCGFGGTFAVKNADTSTAMLADKMSRGARRPGPRSSPPATPRA